MNRFLFIFIFFLSYSALADMSLGLGYSFVTTNSLSEDFKVRSMLGGQIAYDWHDLNLGVELNFFEDKQSEESLASVSRKYLDFIFWSRYNFVNSQRVAVFFGVGSGGYQEKVEIEINGLDSFSDSSTIHWLLSGSLGLNLKLGWFSGAVEYRISRRMAEEVQNQSVRFSTNYSF